MPVDTSQVNQIVDPQTGEVTAATLTFEQASQTYKNFVTDNRERNAKNAAIARKFNNEQPWNPRKLKAAGQSWRSNRPTGFMSSLMKRLTPPYKQMLDQLPLLTYSRFPKDKIGTESQRDIFRAKITDCIRQWSGWSDFLQQLIDEDIGYGYAAASWDDDYSWKPSIYRGDEAYFYVGCPQNAENVKIWGRKKDFFVDEIVEIVRDPESAKAAGWIPKNLIAKLNSGERQFDDKGQEENQRVYEDLIRENNLSSTFSSTIRVVKSGQIIALNPRGGIDHYIFDREDGTPLFFRRARWDKMSQILSLFSAEVGDQTLHGSKGAGRALYNTHVSVEQARNLINDALHLSGLLILKRKTAPGSGTTETPGLTVNHPYAVIGDGFDVLEGVKFEINSEAFFALDRHATSQAEIQVGAFMPGQVINEKGERRTASEVNYTASIDAQIRAGVLARFADQAFTLITEIQRRICSAEVIKFAEQVKKALDETQSSATPVFDAVLYETLVSTGTDEGFQYFEVPGYIDHDALQTVLDMLQEGLTTQQIVILAHNPTRANVEDAIASQSGVLDMIVASYGNDPMIDTVELKRRHIASKIGATAAERLMNVDMNPLSPVKQQRTQLSELTTMLNGNDTPIDPTDDDKIHLGVIVSRITPMLQNKTISPLTSSQQFLQLVVAHGDAHVQAALQKGVKQDELSEFTSILDDIRQYVQVPPVDQAAAAAVAPAIAPGAAPITELAQDAPPLPIPTVPTVNQVIGEVASPVRPTPPKGQLES